MRWNCVHQQKRLDERMRIPAVFSREYLAIFDDADRDFADEAAATAEQQLPEVLESQRPIEQLCLFDAPRNVDALLAVPAELQCFYNYYRNIQKQIDTVNHLCRS